MCPAECYSTFCGAHTLTGYALNNLGHDVRKRSGERGRGRCAMRIFCCLYDRNPEPRSNDW